MICSCSHIHTHHSFVQDIIDVPVSCCNAVSEWLWSGNPNTSTPLTDRTVNQVNLQQILENLAVAVIESGDARPLLSRLEALSMEDLFDATNSNADDTTLKIALLKSPLSTGNQSTMSLRFLGYSLNFIPNLINTLLAAFRLFDTGKDPQTFWEIGAALDILYKFVMIPAAIIFIVHLIAPGLGLAAYAITAAVVIALLGAITIYAKWLKPCPKQLYKCDNLTWMASEESLGPVVGRTKEVDSIISIFNTNKKYLHPLLVGKSGVGKNEIVSALAQRIAAGNVPDNLKGKEIFEIKALLKGVKEYGGPVEALIERLRGNEDQVIFFFDEFHVLLADEVLPNYLIKFFDKFHCIGATTDKEYINLDKENSIFGRLRNIEVAPLQKPQIKEVLHKLADKLTIELGIPLYITDKQYDEIVDAAQSDGKRSQPARAIELFTGIMSDKALELMDSYVPDDLSKKRADHASLVSAWKNCASDEKPAKLAAIKALDEEMGPLEERLIRRKAAVAEYVKALHHLHHHRQSQISLANSISSLKEQEKSVDQQTKLFIFEEEYMLPALEAKIKALGEGIQRDYEFNPCIDTSTLTQSTSSSSSESSCSSSSPPPPDTTTPASDLEDLKHILKRILVALESVKG